MKDAMGIEGVGEWVFGGYVTVFKFEFSRLRRFFLGFWSDMTFQCWHSQLQRSRSQGLGRLPMGSWWRGIDGPWSMPWLLILVWLVELVREGSTAGGGVRFGVKVAIVVDGVVL